MRNENAAASSTATPSHRAIATVVPEREMPGTSANACARPISRAAPHPGFFHSSRLSARRVLHRIAPVTRKAVAGTNGLSKSPSIAPRKNTPTIPAGSVAAASSPTYRQASRSRRSVPRTNSMRRPRYMTITEISVAICTTTSNCTPGISRPRSVWPTTRCPELDTGKNSVTPWSAPRKIASQTFTGPLSLARIRVHRPESAFTGPNPRSPARIHKPESVFTGPRSQAQVRGASSPALTRASPLCAGASR